MISSKILFERVVRLLTHALLIKYGFQVSMENGHAGRLINPAAVFCADRERYYATLAEADKGTDEGLENWCTYVLSGVRDELAKLDRLSNYDYLQKEVLLPAMAYARERQLVTAQEVAVLLATTRAGVIKAGDLDSAMPGSKSSQRTYMIGKLLGQGMLQPIRPYARQYTIGFSNNVLLRGVIRALSDSGFIPAALLGAPRA